ncbi:hypothetical protein Tco_0217416 [Tanacetum coccineum]
MDCSIPHTVKEIQAYVQKQCDEDDAACQEAIMGVIALFKQAIAAKEDLRKQYAECKETLYLRTYITHSTKMKQRQTKKQNLQRHNWMGNVNDKGKGKVDDKGKGKADEKGNAKHAEDDVDLVDALDLQNKIKKLSEDFNRLLKAKKAKEAKEAELAEVVELSSDEEDSSDEGFFGDEDLVLFNDVKYPHSDAEIRMFKERPTTSRAPTASTYTSTRSRAPTASKRFRAPIASTFNAQVTSTAPRAMTGCVLALRSPNDPNAPPP